VPEVDNYMRLALECSVHSIGVSRPNPAVGAVVVKDGIVVGKGRTQRPGSAHAEVMALRDAGELARGAAIYVTLEPCCHYGRTPPCTKAIIDAGIAKVYYAHGDPNPVVRGNSRKILEEAGIEVFEGVNACIAACVDEGWDDACAGGECHCLSMGPTNGPSGVIPDFFHDNSSGVIPSEASSVIPGNAQSVLSGVIPGLTRNLPASDDFFGNMMNSVQRNAALEAAGRYVFHDVERYFEAYDYFVRNRRTFVEIKCAISQEGFMGVVACDGSHLPVRITGENANCWNHELRAISDAVLVGAGTVLADNPSLNVRNVVGNDPVKIIWAGHHEFAAGEIEKLKVFAPSPRYSEIHKERHSENSCDCHSETAGDCHSELGSESPCSTTTEKKRLIVFSCVPQPALSRLSSLVSRLDVVPLTSQTFAENWTRMIDDLSARGMHRLMVEPGATLARELFNAETRLWNRLNIWRSSDCRIDDAIADLASSGNIKEGLEFPELPKNIVAKESFMAGPDVLTVYYPA